MPIHLEKVIDVFKIHQKTIESKAREKQVSDEAIDPFFTATGDLPFQSERRSRDYLPPRGGAAGASDPWYGPVPGMERMFGPTFDHTNWY